MKFEITPDARGHKRQDDIVHAGLADVTDGFDFCQRNFSPGEFLRSTVENVERQSRRGYSEFRKEMGELVRGQTPTICSGAFRHTRYIRQGVENSFDKFSIGVDAAGRYRTPDARLRWNAKPKLSFGQTRRHRARIHDHVHDSHPGNAVSKAMVQTKDERAAITFQPMNESHIPQRVSPVHDRAQNLTGKCS